VGFSLKADESAGPGIKRVVHEQLDDALTELRDAGDTELQRDKAVHSARKRMKRVRAVVRLIRGAIPAETFEFENASFRDAGGALGEARDAAVLVQTLESLKVEIPDPAYRAARKLLVARRRVVKKRILESTSGLEGVAQAAQDANARIAPWHIEGEGWDVFKPGLKRVYRDGREAMQAANIGDLSGHGAEMFHQWRKRVKDLWHQCEVLEKVWPAAMSVLADEFHALADHLGNEHDLAVLKTLLQADAEARGEPIEGAAEVIAIIDHHRLDLQTAAKNLGARLFAEKPGQFAKRLGAYWDAWWQGAKTVGEPPQEPTTVTEAGGSANGAHDAAPSMSS